ncbi:MAG: NADH-quinone oxidoreductase subunit N [Candidatus Micrarchaeaceae archaeon]
MSSIYFYLLFVLASLFVLLNLISKVLGSRRNEHLVLNVTILLLILGDILVLLISGYSGLFAGVFSANPFSLFMASIFTIGLLLVNLIAFNYSENYVDFAVIGAFALIGMYVVSSATSLITIFLGLELASIPMVFAILLSKRNIEAAAKLFIMASIAIAVISFAIVLVYGASNSFALKSYSQGTLIAFAGLLFIAALGFEASIFPFNVLIPDVYSGSSAYVTAMLGGMNKKVGFAALIQILILVFIADKQLFIIVAILSVLTMTYGNIVALMQKNLKRMLAYSSISQAGYILIGIAAATPQGISASLFQIFSHMFLFIGLMAIVALLEKRNRTGIDDLIGLRSENSYLAIALAIFMLSLLGLPFTTGFIGKLLLFLSAINANLVWLAIIGIINSVISIFYYIRAISAAYTEKEGGRQIRMDKTIAAVVFICLFITIAFGIYPQPIISLTNNAAAFLYH